MPGDKLRGKFIPTLVKRVEVSASEISGIRCIRHSNPELMHAVLQLCPSPPIFHSRTPAAVHASSRDVAMLKPLSPEATMYVKEPSWYLPALQMVQTSAFAPEYVPAGQMAQTDAFPPEWYLPAVQLRQPEAPAAAALPAAQLRQPEAPAAAEYVPAAQSAQSAAPANENVPAGQVAQTEAPAAAECLPASHREHVAVAGELEPSGPYSPGLHGESRHVEAAVAECVPAAQISQNEACAHEYVPALQGMQSAAPAAAYLPAGQVSQVNWDCGKVSVYASSHTLPQGQSLAPVA